MALGILIFPYSQAIALNRVEEAVADLKRMLEGAEIYAQDTDNTYLGTITNKYSPDSVLNDYGTYGNKYNRTSIWNTYGTFGGEYSIYSPFNRYSTKPPMIIKNKKIIGYLTVNNMIRNNLDPNVLKQFKK